MSHAIQGHPRWMGLTMLKPLSCGSCYTWKDLREMRIPDHPTYLLRNLYAGQEATVRTLYGTTDPYSSVGKESACNAGDPGSILGSGRFPGEGKGNPLQYSYLENSMDWGVWRATVCGVTESQTWLSEQLIFKTEKGVQQSCLLSPHLTHMLSTSWELLG